MSKNKKKVQNDVIENYYDLKVDKVNELVAALKGEDEDLPPVSMNIADCTGINDSKNIKRNGKQKQFDPYRRDILSRIPAWVKALFIKWWFFGVVCYFVMMGLLSENIPDPLDKLVLTGIVMGIVVEILVNPIFRYMEVDGEYKPYVMFPFPLKAFWTFFTNIIYYCIVVWITSWIYTAINAGLGIFFAIEPLMFGLFTLIVDMAFIGVKDLIVYLIKKIHKKKVAENV